MGSTRRRTLGFQAAAAVVAAAVAVGTAYGRTLARPRPAISTYFRTPGSNVVCGYFAIGGSALLECGVRAPLRPPPPRPSARDCHGLDFAANRVRLRAEGRAVGFCSGDIGVLAERGTAPVLAYGKTWHEGHFRCVSSQAWLSCRNPTGHGFDLSRLRWRSH